jgi:hypothetical protein
MKIARPRPRRLVLEISRLSPTIRRQRREFQRELKAVPRPVPWEWAAPRILPLLSGPRFDPPGEAVVRIQSPLGPMVEFGLPVGHWFARVDRPVAERWECSAEQLFEQGLGNLRQRAAQLDAGSVTTGTMSGRAIRLLDGEPPWASSLLLDKEALLRVFGGHDQLFAASRTDCLLSMALDTPGRVFADIAVDLEREEESLWLDPFVLEAGELSWGGEADVGLDEPDVETGV